MIAARLSDCRLEEIRIDNRNARHRRLGCHPASDFFGFTLRVPSRHQSWQTTKRARHVAFARRKTWSIIHSRSLRALVKVVEPSVIDDVCSDFVSPKQEVG